MMKIQLLSDLHLEVHPHFIPEPAPGADLLVLAGDIGSYQKGSLLSDDEFGLRRFAPRYGWPTPVCFVPGNHEYDGLDFDIAHARLQALCLDLGIHWLERECLVIGEVRLLGTTLWSDFEALSPPDDLTLALQLREKAYRAANHYLRKTGTRVRGQDMLAEQVREQALLCQTWLSKALSHPWAGRTVVVTHFAPSLRSADPRYGLTPGTAGFCNALDPWLAQVDLWLHGHLHAPSNYQVGRCRVAANPLGYARKGEQAGFQPQFCCQV